MKSSSFRILFGTVAGLLLLATSVVAQNPSNASSTTDGSPAMAAVPNNAPAKAATAQTPASTPSNGKKIADDTAATVDLSAPTPNTAAPAANEPDPLKRELSPQQ